MRYLRYHGWSLIHYTHLRIQVGQLAFLVSPFVWKRFRKWSHSETAGFTLGPFMVLWDMY